MNVFCSAKSCPVLLSATCVFYEGENLLYTGINTNDTVQLALQKIDAAFSDAILDISAVLPISVTSGPSPIISISKATATSNGYLSSIDWNIFNNKQNAVTLTTTGSTGVSTFNGVSGALNIPDYSAAFPGFVPITRTLSINGTSYDLSANRSWNVGTVTSIGVSMPSAFTVSNSPITSSGTIAVTGAGLASQYVRGDGALGDFPASGGGGSSVSYYLNGSVNQGVFGGSTYYEMNRTPIVGGPGTNFSITNTTGLISQFITDPIDPGLLLLPGGNWNIEFYFNASDNLDAPYYYVELYIYNGTTFTFVASNISNPEYITNGTSVDVYYTSLAVPETILSINDRLAIRVYGDTDGTRTITLHTEGDNLSQIITTFANGLTALNGLTRQVQYLATSTTGIDFTISSSVDTHTFNLPSSSASVRGLLTPTDWSIFNSKIGGTGVSGQVAYWNGTSTQTGSNNLFWDAANSRLGIGTILPIQKLTVTSTDADVLGVYRDVDVLSVGPAGVNLDLGARKGTVFTTGARIIGVLDGTGNNGTLTFNVSSSGTITEYVRIASDGNVGIGTNNPLARLVIADSGESVARIQDIDGTNQFMDLGHNGGDSYFLTRNGTTGGSFIWYTNDGTVSTERMKITPVGVLSVNDLSGSGTRMVVASSTGVLSTQAINVGTVTSISTSGPITGGTITSSGTIGITQSSGSTNGYLSSTDWTIFNNKQNTITLTTTGSSGVSTFISNTLNIPNYTLSGLGGVPSSRQLTINGTAHDLSADRSWTVGTITSIATTGPITGGTITTSGTIGITQATTSTAGYLSSTDWNTFNGKQAQLNGTGFVKASGTTISYDNSSYYLASNPLGFISSNIYTNNGTLTGDRTVDCDGYLLKFDDSNGIEIITTPHTNNAIYIEAAEPNIHLKAMGATNGAALFLSPSSSGYYGAIHNRTGGGLELYVGAAGGGGIPTVGLVLEPTKQLKLNAYTSTSSFPGTASAYLAVNTSGEVITVSGSTGSGTVTSVATSGPITGGTITTSGTIGITQATTGTDGYLSSTDWNTFNGKIDYNIYTQNGTLTGNRTVLTTSGYTLTLNPQTSVLTALTASTAASSYAILGQNTFSYVSGFSSTNLGHVFGASGGISLQTFNGSATFAEANLAAGHVSVNSINFSLAGAGSTITMTQSSSPGVRAMAGHIAQVQYTRAQSGTVSHLAIQQNLGIYMPAGVGVLTVTNAYSFLINPLDDYGISGLTLTNRWGIYQASPNDKNYFAGKTIIGTSNTLGGATSFKVTGLPTSSAGLSTGDVWNNSGVLTVV
jgi:hypothetical protein